MSEVTRYFAGNIDKDREVYLADDFDRVTAERDALAQNLRFAEEGYQSFAEECDALQQRLTAANERADVLEGRKGDLELSLMWVRSQLTDAAIIRFIEIALKPSEGGSDEYRKSCEVAHKALSLENQRITPARFKCLACGEYHEGSGNLPCPSMSPYSRIEQ